MVNKIKLVIRGSLLSSWLLLQLTILSLAQTPANSWKLAQSAKKATLNIIYIDNAPFIYKEGNALTGIEKELLEAFIVFVDKKYQTTLKLDFRPASNTQTLRKQVKQSLNNQAVLGISCVAITPQIRDEFTLTPPYCADIALLISNSAVPSINNSTELKKIMGDFTALYPLNFDFETYVDRIKTALPQVKSTGLASSREVLKKIDAEIDKFGYVTLPQYLFGLKKGLRIKPQNLLKLEREGYAWIMPKNSDWNEPLNEFFQSKDFKNQLPVILRKYLKTNIDELLIKTKSSNNDKEGDQVKAIQKQLKDLETQKAAIEHRRDQLFFNIFITGFILAAIILLLLYRNNLQKQKSNVLLQKQKEEIESQKDALEEKNEQILQQKEEISQQRDDVIAKNIEIEKRKDELKKLNQVKDRLFSIVSHDLRSPLNSLKGTLALMEMGALDAEEIGHFSTELNKELAYVLELMENLLKWAKAQMDGMEAMLGSIDIYELVNQNVGLLQPIADKKYIKIVNEVPQSVIAHGDEEMIKLVIRNLISNAIKFTRDSGQIQVQTKQEGNELEVSIKDNGVGIGPEKLARLFDADTHFTTKGTNSEKGTGLGLLICKEFIEKNNGHIWVESTLGEGSTFKFTLKLSGE